MNPEGKQTLNTETNLKKKLQVFYEQGDHASASQNSAVGQAPQPNQPSPYLPGETPEQFERMIATVPKMTSEKLAKWKKSSPHLFIPNQSSNIPQPGKANTKS